MTTMTENMKQRFRIYRRHGSSFYLFDCLTKKRESLQTTDKPTALRLLHAKNEAHQQPIINRQIARAYLAVSDPQINQRTWQVVMNEIIKTKRGSTLERWKVCRFWVYELREDLPRCVQKVVKLLKT